MPILAPLALLSALSAPQVSADTRLAAIKAVRDPEWDVAKSAEPTYRSAWVAKFLEQAAQRRTLILEFYRAYPKHPETLDLLNRRWNEMTQYQFPPSPKTLQLAREDAARIERENRDPAIAQAAAYWRANFGVMAAAPNADGMLAAAEPFLRRFPKDARGSGMLFAAAEQTKDPERQAERFRRVAKAFPGTRDARIALGTLHLRQSIGKPLPFDFTDAVSGRRVNSADLRGKVVVLDFWATWCGPCLAEMPKMKKLYAEYRHKGLEIVGVSLDYPANGLKALQSYVAKEKIEWPQYFQGNGVDSDFSMRYGVNAIPRLFILDREGRLIDAEGREGLEAKVRRLIETGK